MIIPIHFTTVGQYRVREDDEQKIHAGTFVQLVTDEQGESWLTPATSTSDVVGVSGDGPVDLRGHGLRSVYGGKGVFRTDVYDRSQAYQGFEDLFVNDAGELTTERGSTCVGKLKSCFSSFVFLEPGVESEPLLTFELNLGDTK
jgi:hypothetical protein